MSGSTPSMTITSPMRSTAPARSRSTGTKSGFAWPFAAIVSASSASFCSRRAMSRSSWPCSANTCARAVPMPADAPVISVTGRMSCLADPATGRHALGLGGLGDKLVGRRLVEAEPPLDDGMQLVALDLRHVAVDRYRVNQEGGGSETIIVGLEAARMLAALRDIGQEFSEGLKHDDVAAGTFTPSRCTPLPRS